MMKQRRRWWLRALISLSLLVVVCLAIFFSMPTLLIAPAIEAKSDVILHGAISKHSTADKYVVDLYRRGVARKIVCASSQISWELYPGDYARDSLIAQGLPAEDVISLRLPQAPCGRMYLAKIVEFVKANGWKRVLYVTNPEDSRHLNNMARRFLEIDGVTITVSYSPEDRNELTRDWWRAHWKAQRIFGEAMVVLLDRFYSECR